MNSLERISRRDVRQLAGIAAAYFFTHELAFFFPASDRLVMAVWPASGVGLAALLLVPRRLWPAVVTVLFLTGNAANLLIGRPLGASVGFMTANVLESLGSAWLISHWCGEKVRFNRVRDVLALLAVVGGVNAVTALLGAAIGATVAALPFWSAWSTWWVADGLGLLLIAPLALAWADIQESSFVRVRWARAAEWAASLTLWCAIAWLAFNPHRGWLRSFSPQPYLLVALLVLIGFRHGQRGVTAALVLLAVIVLTSQAVSAGPLLWGGTNLTERQLLAECYLGLVALTGLLLAASDAERKSGHAALAALERRHQILLETGSDGIHVLDFDGRIVEVNGAFCRMLGYSRAELLRLNVADFAAQFSGPEEVLEIFRENFRRPRVFETIIRTKAGALVPVEIVTTSVTFEGQRFLYAAARDITDRQRAEAAVRASEAQLRIFIESSPVALAMFDRDMRYLQVSRRWMEDYRLGERDVRGRSHYEIFPEIPERWKEIHRRGLAGETIRAEEDRFERDDGPEHWLRWEVRPWYNAAGGTGGILIFSEDISGRKRAELALSESEDKFAKVFHDAPVWVAITELADGTYVDVNEQTLQASGFSREEMIGHTSVEIGLVTAGDRALLVQAVQDRGRVTSHEMTFRAKDGRMLRGLLNGEMINVGGQPRLLTVTVDITARKQAEAALLDRERGLREAQRVGRMGSWSWDLASDTVWWSEELYRLNGYDPELPPPKFADFKPRYAPESWERLQTAAERAVSAGEPYTLELEIFRRDGQSRWHLARGEVRKDASGRVVGLQGTVQDITERRQVESALRESETRLRAILENSRDAIGVSKAGRHVHANPAYLKLFGLANNEALIGTSIGDLIAPSHRLQIAQFVQRRAAGQPVPSLYEARGRRTDGTEFDAEISVSSYELNGESYSLAHIRDITERKHIELATRESEARYRMLVELSPEAVFVHADGRIVFANQAGARLTGAESPQALVGARVLDFVQPESHSVVEQRFKQMAETGQVAPLMTQKWRRLDGSTVVVAVVANPLLFAGRPATLVLAVDVTAQHHAESELRKLSRAVEQSPVTVLITDATGAIEYVNPSFTSTTGYTLAEARGRNPRILRSGELPATVYRDLWATITSGREWRGEFHNRKKNGELFWEMAVISPITDEAGRITHFLAVKEDITERKAAEVRIREQAALLDVTVDAIMVLNFDGEIAFWNRGAERLYGLAPAEVLGRRYNEIVHRELPPNFDTEWRQCLAQGEFAAERRQVSRTRGELTVQIRAVLMRDDSGRGKSVLVVATDITEAKRFEAQFLRAQRLESLGSLASGVAHDLNNVLTPILMSVDLLHPLARGEGDREVLRLVGDSARRGADIVQQLLLFGRGSTSPRAPVDVARVVKDVGQMMRRTFPKHLVLDVQAPADLRFVEADRTQLYQVLMNLCVNARDAMSGGGRLVVLAENRHVDEALARSHGGTGAGVYVRIEVKDSGTGIPAAHLERIFDPFFTTKPAGEGTGLGLATVLGIVRSHGGFVAVDSQVGSGSTFAVYLPAAKSGAEAALDANSPLALGGSGEWILLVEDETSIRSAMQQALASHHYQVLVAADGAEALEVFEQNAALVKLILTDAIMPAMSGAQLLVALHRSHPDLPVVVVSGMAAQRAEFEERFGPKVRFLPKPFTSELLLQVVREALDEAYPPVA